MSKQYLLISDFDQTLSFTDSGLAQFWRSPIPLRTVTCAGESSSPPPSANRSLSSISRSRR